MGNKDEMSLKVVYGRDFQGHGDGGWGPGCTKRGWGSSACLDGDKEVKGDPTTSPPAQRGPRDAKAGLCSKGRSEGPRGTGTAAARLRHGCGTGNPVRPQGKSLSPCEWGVLGLPCSQFLGHLSGLHPEKKIFGGAWG